MQRNIYLEGELGSKFGSKLSYNAPTVADVMKLLDVNNEEFRPYLIQAHEKGVGFHIDVAGESLEYDEEVLLPLNEGDITITPVPAGAKGGGAKIFAAILIIVLIVVTGGFAGLGASGTTAANAGWAVAAGGGLSTTGMLVAGFAMSLAMSGIAEMMAPDPATDADQQSSYLFNGSEKNVIEGDPVPILYGRLKIPGQPVNFEISNVNPSDNMSIGDRIQQDIAVGFGSF
jgi:predicted phage tail protein